LHDDDDADNYVYDLMGDETIPEEEVVPPPLIVTAILADVDRQLADHPIAAPTSPNGSDDVDLSDDDQRGGGGGSVMRKQGRLHVGLVNTHFSKRVKMRGGGALVVRTLASSFFEK
jgi:hypothetical protein